MLSQSGDVFARRAAAEVVPHCSGPVWMVSPSLREPRHIDLFSRGRAPAEGSKAAAGLGVSSRRQAFPGVRGKGPHHLLGGAIMTSKNVTRVELCAAVYETVKLSRFESSILVDLVLEEITDTLAKGEAVKLASFGSFIVRKKKQRPGRNPKTGTEVSIPPRRVVVFKPSAILKQQMNGKRSGTNTAVAALGSSEPRPPGS